MVSHVITWQTDLYYIPQHHLASFRIKNHPYEHNRTLRDTTWIALCSRVEVNPHLRPWGPTGERAALNSGISMAGKNTVSARNYNIIDPYFSSPATSYNVASTLP
jgi:hypothetical protein